MPRILLVEDDETSRDMLTLRLELNGYEVAQAGDGREALQQARSIQPDLILLDMNLPVLDGWATARALREEAATRAIPIIGVSAHAMAGDRQKAIDAGCDDYETKPVSWDRLAPIIRRLLAGGVQ